MEAIALMFALQLFAILTIGGKGNPMKALDGWKTYLAAGGLLGLALYQFSQGQVELAVQSVLAALAAAGLRSAIDRVQS